MLEFLIPGVQDAEKSDLGAKVLGISGNLYEGLRATANNRLYITCLFCNASGANW